jgi:hypothetical protein
MAPLLMPEPRAERETFDAALAGPPEAGETAESPDGAVGPVPAFCANANELVRRTVDTAAINDNFMPTSNESFRAFSVSIESKRRLWIRYFDAFS